MKTINRVAVPWIAMSALLFVTNPDALARSGSLDHFVWTLQGNPDGSGTVDSTTMTVVSPEGATCGPTEGMTYFETVAPIPGEVRAFMTFFNPDSVHFEKPIRVVNGVATSLLCDDTCLSMSAPISFAVEAGDSFGLGAWAVDCTGGASTATFTQFEFVPDAEGLVPGTLRFWPGTSTGAFGTSLDGAGDVNADGVADLIIGAPQDFSQGTVGAGHARVLSGKDGVTLHAFYGTAFADALGRDVTAAGDVDGDGHADFAIGTPGAGDGAAELRSGKTGQLIRAYHGTSSLEELGWNLDGGGDLDGDGVNDLIVASPGAATTVAKAGRIQVFSGSNGVRLLHVKGAAPNARLGTGAAYAGDVDGDGFLDVVVGSPNEVSGGFQFGAVRVFSGTTGATLLSDIGPNHFSQFGVTVAAAGDGNSDGRDDVVVGAPSGNLVLTLAGEVRALSGADGSTMWSLDGQFPYERLGTAVDGAIDLDGDGVGDVVVGQTDITSFVPTAGRILVVSGKDGTSLFEINGKLPDAHLGASVAFLGDVNGDGVPEFAAGSPKEGNFGGAARIFSGSCGSSESYGAGCPTVAGATPTLILGGCMARGVELRVAIFGGPAGAPALLAVAGASSNTPLPGGCSLLVGTPSLMIATGPLAGLGPAGGGIELAGRLPTTLSGSFYAQAFVVDAAGPLGFVSTQGVAVTVK